MKVKCMFVCFLLCASGLFPLNRVGKILGISGSVTIDIQGKGAYIKAIAGDLLYDKSVIKTGDGAYVVVEIDNKVINLVPNSTIVVEKIANQESDKFMIDSVSLGRLMKLLEQLIESNFLKEEETVHGTIRGYTEKNCDNFIWEWPVDLDLYDNALTAMSAKEYSRALGYLKAIGNPDNMGVSPSIDICRALCSFFLYDFKSADLSLATPHERVAQNMDDYNTITLIGFIRGICWFFLGNMERSQQELKSCLSRTNCNELIPYAYHMLALSLLQTGQRKEAIKYLRSALDLFPDSALNKLWQKILSELQ
jgi:tetratricopeptide (TPR) repeat protein